MYLKVCFKIAKESAYDAYSNGYFLQKKQRNISSAYFYNRTT